MQSTGLKMMGYHAQPYAARAPFAAVAAAAADVAAAAACMREWTEADLC